MPEEAAFAFPIGEDTAIGILHTAQAAADLGVVIIVGGPQTRVGSHRQFVLLARRLAAAGYPVFRFDYRGIGDSGGTARDFEAVDEDVRVAVDELVERTGVTRVVLWGLCDAASAAMMYAHRDARVSALALANPWVHSPHTEARARLQTYYWGRLGSRDFWHKLARFDVDWRDSFESLAGYLGRAMGRGRPVSGQGAQQFIVRMLEGWQRFTGPSLLLLSGDDLTAAEFRALAAQSRAWQVAAARDCVQTVALAEANHTFSSAAWRAQVEDATLAWLRNLVDETT
ncbi:MAG: hydrolase 1, exosortase A system-associated [Gammaproteobacteria bacterium]